MKIKPQRKIKLNDAEIVIPLDAVFIGVDSDGTITAFDERPRLCGSGDWVSEFNDCSLFDVAMFDLPSGVRIEPELFSVNYIKGESFAKLTKIY